MIIDVLFLHYVVCQSIQKKFNDLCNIQSQRIGDLCSETGEQSWEYPVFDDAANLTKMLLHFAILTSEEFKNDIFHCKWEEFTKQSDASMSFSDIHTTLWDPVFHYCASLPKQLECLDISLYEADWLFNGLYIQPISDSISHLVNAVHCSEVSMDVLHLAKLFDSQDTNKNMSVSSLVVKEATKFSKTISTKWTLSVAKNIHTWCNLNAIFNEAKEFSSVLASYSIDNGEVVSFYEMVYYRSVRYYMFILLYFSRIFMLFN